MTLALVPVKRLAQTNSRLLAHLGADAREAFALAMLRDVIGALLAAHSVDRTVVVTPDKEVGAAARDAGAEALVRDDPGLNPAIEAGARELVSEEGESLLVMLGDVAGASPADIDALAASRDAHDGRSVVLAPSSDGGTSALLRTPHDVIPARFGPDSAKQHREAAAARGVPYRELPLPSLALDLDVPEDVDQFLATTLGGSETRRALAELGWRS